MGALTEKKYSFRGRPWESFFDLNDKWIFNTFYSIEIKSLLLKEVLNVVVVKKNGMDFFYSSFFSFFSLFFVSNSFLCFFKNYFLINIYECLLCTKFDLYIFFFSLFFPKSLFYNFFLYSTFL